MPRPNVRKTRSTIWIVVNRPRKEAGTPKVNSDTAVCHRVGSALDLMVPVGGEIQNIASFERHRVNWERCVVVFIPEWSKVERGVPTGVHFGPGSFVGESNGCKLAWCVSLEPGARSRRVFNLGVVFWGHEEERLGAFQGARHVEPLVTVRRRHRVAGRHPHSGL